MVGTHPTTPILVVLALVGGLVAACTQPEDSAAQPDESALTTTASGTLDAGDDTTETDGAADLPPAELAPVPGPGTEPPQVEPPLIEDGPIVVVREGEVGWTAFDAQLDRADDGDEVGLGDGQWFATWPGRLWEVPIGVGDGFEILDTAANDLVPFTGVTIGLHEVAGRDERPGPARYLSAVTEGETVLVDLQDLDAHLLGGDPRFGGPVVSPDERWVMTDSEASAHGLLAVAAAAAVSPREPVWTYTAPPGLTFVDVGRFRTSGKLAVQLRTIEVDPLQLFTYHGELGQPLRLIDDPERAAWDDRLPRLVDSLDGTKAVVHTDDGTITEIDDGAHLGCEQGPAVAVGTEEQVRFIERDRSQTMVAELVAPNPFRQPDVDNRHRSIDRFDLHVRPVSDIPTVLVVDCDQRAVIDLTAQFLSEDGRQLVVGDPVVALSGRVAAVPAFAAPDRALVVVDEVGPRVELLPHSDRVILSPSGDKILFVVDEDGSTLLQIRDTATLTVEAEHRIEWGVASLSVTWVPRPS